MTENTLRLVFFLGGLVGFSGLQLIMPSRPFMVKRYQYTLSNLGLVVFNNGLLFLLPLVPIQAAYWMVGKPVIYDFPIVIEVLILDVVIYFQHRFFHSVDFLWKLHRVHHADPMLETSTGLRFHPLEILISNFIKVGTIYFFGIDPLSVVIFEIGLNLLSMFNHSNLNLPQGLEDILSKFLITPALHTIHHSKIQEESKSNFGFSVPWWDMIFKTFKAQGQAPQAEIKLGTYPMPKASYRLFPGLLLYPFVKEDLM